MPSNLYIQDGEEIYELSLTTDVNLTLPSSTTKYPVESGSNISDHNIKQNKKVTFQGFITYARNLFLAADEQKTTLENLEALQLLSDSRRLFTVFYDQGFSLDNCVFTTLSFNKSSGMGNSYKVSMSMEQNRLSKSATRTAIPEQSEDIANQHSDKKQGSDNNTEEIDAKEETTDEGSISYRIGRALLGTAEEREADKLRESVEGGNNGN